MDLCIRLMEGLPMEPAHWGAINRRTFLKGVAMGTAGVAFSSAFSGGATAGDKKSKYYIELFIQLHEIEQ